MATREYAMVGCQWQCHHHCWCLLSPPIDCCLLFYSCNWFLMSCNNFVTCKRHSWDNMDVSLISLLVAIAAGLWWSYGCSSFIIIIIKDQSSKTKHHYLVISVWLSMLGVTSVTSLSWHGWQCGHGGFFASLACAMICRMKTWTVYCIFIQRCIQSLAAVE